MTAEAEPVGAGDPPAGSYPYAELVDELPGPRPALEYPLGTPRYEPLPPSRMELLRRSYYDAVDLARSIDRLDLEDRARILDCIAAAWPEVVAAAIEDIARGHRYEYALELAP